MTDSLASGFSGPTVCRLTGVTYRQLDTGAHRSGDAFDHAAKGSGSKRAYSYADVLEVKVIKSLLNSGSPWRGRASGRVSSQCLGADLASSSLVMSDSGSVLAKSDATWSTPSRRSGFFNIVPLAAWLPNSRP